MRLGNLARVPERALEKFLCLLVQPEQGQVWWSVPGCVRDGAHIRLRGAMSQPKARMEACFLEDSGSWQIRCSIWHCFPHDKGTSHKKLVFPSLGITEVENSYIEGDIYVQTGNTLTLIILL